MQDIAQRNQQAPMQAAPHLITPMPQRRPMQQYDTENRCAPGTVGAPRYPTGHPPKIFGEDGSHGVTLDGYRQFETEMRIHPTEVPRCFRVLFDTGGYKPLAQQYAPELRWKNNLDYLAHISTLSQRCDLFMSYLQQQKEAYTTEGLKAWKERKELEQLLQLKSPTKTEAPKPTLQASFNHIWGSMPTEEVKQTLQTLAKQLSVGAQYVQPTQTQQEQAQPHTELQVTVDDTEMFDIDYDNDWQQACDEYQSRTGPYDTSDEYIEEAPPTPVIGTKASPCVPRRLDWADEEEVIPQLPPEIMRDLPTEEGKRRRLAGKQSVRDLPAPETPQLTTAAAATDDKDEKPPAKPKNPQAARAASAARTAGSARISKVRSKVR